MSKNEFPKEQIEQLFYDCYSPVDDKAILELNEREVNGNINNVVVGLARYCCCTILLSEQKEVEFQFLYIYGGNAELEGDCLTMSLTTRYRDYVLFYFCNFLTHNYDDVDSIDTFNTFQGQLRTMLEKIGFITVDNFTVDKFENPVFFAPDKRGVIKINLLDRLRIYQDVFEVTNCEIATDYSGNHLYLMLNKRNNYIKIGKSKTPGFREKTLQADEPEIELLIAWQAPAQVEKELHRIFNDKRERGEWFNLRLKELKIIREYMKPYSKAVKN